MDLILQMLFKVVLRGFAEIEVGGQIVKLTAFPRSEISISFQN